MGNERNDSVEKAQEKYTPNWSGNDKSSIAGNSLTGERVLLHAFVVGGGSGWKENRYVIKYRSSDEISEFFPVEGYYRNYGMNIFSHDGGATVIMHVYFGNSPVPSNVSSIDIIGTEDERWLAKKGIEKILLKKGEEWHGIRLIDPMYYVDEEDEGFYGGKWDPKNRFGNFDESEFN